MDDDAARYGPGMITAHDVRRIAVESITDPRTVNRFLRGESVRSMTSARIAAALEKLGIAIPAPAPATPPEAKDAA